MGNGLYFGIDVGGTTVKMSLYSSKEDSMVENCSIPSIKNENENILIGNIVKKMKEMSAEAGVSISEVSGIGIGIPGPVTADGKVLKCANLGWDIVDLTTIIKELTGVENVEAGNDANVAALGEIWKGAAAGYKDAVMVTLGTGVGGGIGGEHREGENELTCGEGYDTHELVLPPSQRRLFNAISDLGKPTVLILYAGRPYAIAPEVSRVNGFMFSWGGGEQSGTAFANLIFGDVSPSAKLSVSFPQSTGHIPCYYNHKVSARGSWYKTPGSIDNPGRDYVLSSPDAWYAFGCGLSYTTVKYSDLSVKTLNNGQVMVSVTIENIGKYDINESVLLFLRVLYSPITPFVKRLRKFKKVFLKKGAKKNVEFVLNDDDFTYVDANFKTTKLPGKYKIMIQDLVCDVTIE